MRKRTKNLYNENSIESLSPLEFTRLRPQVYAGDCTYSTQLAVEILSNAVDEFRLGHGDQIDISINKNVITIEDHGQGFIPNSTRDDGKTILEAAFSVINTSGKYREDGTYEGTSLGSFGIGSKITTFLSHWLEVVTYRDGQYEHIRFKEGEFEKRESGKWEKDTTGTVVSWEPSEEFFTHPEIEIAKFRDLLHTTASLCQGLTINLDYNGTKEIYYSANGIDDLVDAAIKDTELIDNRCRFNYQQGKEKMDFVLTYTTNYSSTIVPYVNTGLTEKGPHIVTIKTILTREFNKFFRDKGWIKEKEENLTGDDVQEGMYIVFNLTAPGVGYDAQVKSTITQIDMSNFSTVLVENLNIWFQRNEKEVKLIADKALAARRAREAAKKARDNARNLEIKGKTKFINLPTKLVDAWSKDRSECELFITEGDSAANGLIGARDGKTQAIFPIRGKILSVRKSTVEKIYANQEIANIVQALGLDIDKKTQKLVYDTNKLRYGKIIFACDADPDGQAIKNLLINCFHWLCPDLLTKGHIYVAVPPLFRITTKKNEYIYLKDADALNEYRKSHKNDKYLINRMKGLGEQDPEELAQCLLEEETRNVQQLIVDDERATDDLLEIVEGVAVPPRRQYLLEHGEETTE